jgi:AcrR family transcriptional regulator
MTSTARIDPDEAARQTRAEHPSAQLLDAAARLMERDGSQAASMQAVAAEAGVSVGLIYRYFGGKDDLLLAVILGVLDSFATHVPEAVEAAGDDPVTRLGAAFRSYCEVIDEHRHAAVLTYRETKSLSAEGRQRIKELEVQTSEPLRSLLRGGSRPGCSSSPTSRSSQYFERTLGFDDYVTHQTALMLRSIIEPRHRRKYAALLDH